MNSKVRLISPVIALIAGFFLAVPALADQVVYFVNGKAITVKKVEKGDRITILEVEGGGRIGIPSEQIDRIEELLLSNPAPAIPAPPPPVLPAAGIGPQAQAGPVAAPATATLAAPPPAAGAGGPVGPMIGGKPTQPGGGLAGLQPLDVGGGGDDGPTKIPAAAMGPTAARGMTPMTGPGVAATRRFNARGNPFGRMRPPSVNYVQPGQAAPAAGAKPATPGNTPAPPPPPPPAPPVPDPQVADPGPDSQGDADTPAESPGEEPPSDDGPPED